MNLFERLPQEDIHQLWMYLDTYSGGGSAAISEEHMSYFLRFWEEAKVPFYRMFDEKFIIKKEILFERPYDELEDEMNDMTHYGSAIIQRFISAYKSRIGEICGSDYEMKNYLFSFVEHNLTLIENEYKGPAITIPGEYTKTGRPLLINSGCKAVKMLGKIVDAIEVKVTTTVCNQCGRVDLITDSCPWCSGDVHLVDGYEAFRRAHSLILNQKHIKGNLCLSIHPLDYLTMSDNECDWSSCMSWMEDAGDYRLGTIEMMNSPCVIIAYVEAKNDMYLMTKAWNNKRWRQLYIVTREMILGNRQYPYTSDVLQGATIKWIRDLCQSAVGWGPYMEETHQIRNDAWNTLSGDLDVKFKITCDYMYNDVYGYRLAYIAPSRFEDMNVYRLNFSGPAVCTGCGEIIPYDTIDPSCVQCRGCDGSWQCDNCGGWHAAYTEPNYVDGYYYCDWCYVHTTEECECCGDRTRDPNHIYIQFTDSKNEEIISGFNYNFYVSMCDDCLENIDDLLEDYGPLYEVRDMLGHIRKAFDVRNLSNAALQRGDFSNEAIRLLKLMRDSKSDKERLKLIQEFSY